MNSPTPDPSQPGTAGDPRGTVHIVDDDVSFLRSMSRLLRAAGFHVIQHASAAELLAAARPDGPGCVVTDLRMPGMDGMALQEALHQAGCPLPVIFLTGHGDIPTTVQAMRNGAEDFLTKLSPRDQILGAIRRALARSEREQARDAELTVLRQRFGLLSEREREVLRHVVQGKLNKQIAADLGIHERTVKFHRTHITSKLQVHSVADLTRMAEAAGIFG